MVPNDFKYYIRHYNILVLKMTNRELNTRGILIDIQIDYDQWKGVTAYNSERLRKLAILIFYLNKVLSYIDNILVNYLIFCISSDTVYSLKGKTCQRLIVSL